MCCGTHMAVRAQTSAQQESGPCTTRIRAYRSTSMTLAGTDLLHELRFRHRVEHYRRDLIGALNREHAYGGAGRRARRVSA